MRLARVFAVGIVAAFLIYAFPAAQGQDADKKVAGEASPSRVGRERPMRGTDRI